MPDRRMIHRKITASTQVAALVSTHGPFAGMFWTWLIPFYDRYGCVPDDTRWLKVSIMPGFEEVTEEDIKEWVAWLRRRKMLVRVKGPTGARGLRNPHFEEHQAGAKFEREAPSQYEPPEVTEKLARKGRKAPNSRVVRTRSGPGPDLVRPKEGRKEPPQGGSPSPLPPPSDSAAAPPEPEPGAQSPPPGANGQGHDVGDRLDRQAIMQAALSPTMRAGIAHERQVKAGRADSAARRRTAGGGA